MEQLVWICDSHEVADERNSEIPQWPVQDEGGRWHHEQFPGQRVVYDHARVDFGFQVKPCVMEPSKWVDELSETQRGEQGFGSTGR